MLRVCVLGGNSFLGAHIVQKFLQKGFYVRSFVRRPSLSALFDDAKAEQVVGNFFYEHDLRRALKDIDICIHLISTSTPSLPKNVCMELEENVCGTLKMLDVACELGVKKILFASSGGTVYGEAQHLPISESAPTLPICSYGVIKLMIEKYLAIYKHKYGLDYVALRIANPYGPYYTQKANQGIINIFLQNILHKQPIYIFGDGLAVRDYIYAEDVADAFLCAVESNTQENIFNIGSGCGVNILSLVETIKNTVNIDFDIVYRENRQYDVSKNVLDIGKAAHEMGWVPAVGLKEGILRTIAYIKKCG